MTRERMRALSVALGSACFLVAPVGVYARLVGSGADAATFFAGSIPFTIGGAIQTWMAFVDRRAARAGWSLWRSAGVQSAGTVFFNMTTVSALSVGVAAAGYDRLVWRPDAYGSACFLASGLIAYAASPRRGVRPVTGSSGWWEPAVNLLGCVLFGISAVAAFSPHGSDALIGPTVDAWTTSLGAACFAACAVATLVSGITFKSPRLRRWERDLEQDVEELVGGEVD